MSYNNLVSNLRAIARDQLRMEAVSLLRDRLFNREESKTNFEKAIIENDKRIAVKNYQISKLEDANPEKAELLKKYEDGIKDIEAATTKDKEIIAEEIKAIAAINETIAKWESGENKVDAYKMELIAMDLVKFVTNEAARNLCELLPTPADTAIAKKGK